MARGKLRLYLGAAPGVGKTYAMLNEGWRRKERGTDVVIGWVEEHGRPQTDAQIRDLEIFPRRPVELPGPDLRGDGPRRPAGPPARAGAGRRAGPHQRPRVQARQAVAGRRGAARRRASTSSPRSTSSTSSRSTTWSSASPAWPSTRRCPTAVVRAADQIELVDMAPEALRRRLAHGNVYPPGTDRRRPGQLLPDRQPHRPAGAGPAVGGRPGRRGAAATTGSATASPGPGRPRSGWWSPSPDPRGSAVLIRRAARMAMRTKAELVGVHVRTDDGLTGAGSTGLAATGPCSTSSAAATSRWWGPTWPRPWSRWPGPRTPPSWSWAPPTAAA